VNAVAVAVAVAFEHHDVSSSRFPLRKDMYALSCNFCTMCPFHQTLFSLSAPYYKNQTLADAVVTREST